MIAIAGEYPSLDCLHTKGGLFLLLFHMCLCSTMFLIGCVIENIARWSSSITLALAFGEFNIWLTFTLHILRFLSKVGLFNKAPCLSKVFGNRSLEKKTFTLTKSVAPKTKDLVVEGACKSQTGGTYIYKAEQHQNKDMSS